MVGFGTRNRMGGRPDDDPRLCDMAWITRTNQSVQPVWP